MATDDDRPTPSISETLRHHGLTPCPKCKGWGTLPAHPEDHARTVICGKCDGTGIIPDPDKANGPA